MGGLAGRGRGLFGRHDGGHGESLLRVLVQGTVSIEGVMLWAWRQGLSGRVGASGKCCTSNTHTDQCLDIASISTDQPRVLALLESLMARVWRSEEVGRYLIGRSGAFREPVSKCLAPGYTRLGKSKHSLSRRYDLQLHSDMSQNIGSSRRCKLHPASTFGPLTAELQIGIALRRAACRSS